ncbi:hypothetical protein GP5015_394 [gamma proteobacterium HTCC5015]|nr:hypothetical protein GP5015_394 [gamma proteobacterium HTCC5015]
MNINKVMAIFDEFRLKNVEETLIRHGVKGFTLHPDLSIGGKTL